MTSATVLLSGGMDSALCAHYFLKKGLDVDGLFVDYSQQAASREKQSAEKVADHLKFPLLSLTIQGSRYFGPGELVGRNAFLILTALLQTGGRSGILGLGLHAGTPYFDCTEAFVSDINKLVAEHTDGKVSVVAPFINWTKSDIYAEFMKSGLPIASTYSCEAGGIVPCGVCASCLDRKALGC